MVKLDYRTNNPRWGLKGINFNSWESYSLTLGYVSNPNHYNNLNSYSQYANISLHIEGNNEQGAWDKEGRIHYYGKLSALGANLDDLDACSSAGTGRITRRINSNGYLLSLINDYGFEVKTYVGYTTADVFPTDKSGIETELRRQLLNKRLNNSQINDCLEMFERGYSLLF